MSVLNLLTDLYFRYPWALIAAVMFGVVLGTVAYMILMERKVASYVQDRIGPNRVGPLGLFQPIADGIKMFTKEDYRPANCDRVLFTVAPAIMMLVMIVSLAALPWGGFHQVQRLVADPGIGAAVTWDQVAPAQQAQIAASLPGSFEVVGLQAAPGGLMVTYRYPFQIARLELGVFFTFAVLSLAVYGIVIAGWASNNKYSLLGGLRAAAQMISYEIPLGLSLLCILVMYGTLDLNVIVDRQAHYWWGIIPAWNVFAQPVAFLLFLICLHAEANRAPFDQAEAEQELVGGYHTEYASMRLGLLLLGEYAGMITTSAVCAALFFGGWHLPGLSGTVDAARPDVTDSLIVCVIRLAVFYAKTMGLIFVFMWVRWSLPRMRYDQLMLLVWRSLVPMSFALFLVTGILVLALGMAGGKITGIQALWFCGANIVVVLAALGISRLLPKGPEVNHRVRLPGSRFSSPVAEQVVPAKEVL